MTRSLPSNVYSFVQKITSDLSKSPSEAIQYGTDDTVKQLKSMVTDYSDDLKAMTQRYNEQQKNLREMEAQMAVARSELASSRSALSNVTKKLEAERVCT